MSLGCTLAGCLSPSTFSDGGADAMAPGATGGEAGHANGGHAGTGTAATGGSGGADQWWWSRRRRRSRFGDARRHGRRAQRRCGRYRRLRGCGCGAGRAGGAAAGGAAGRVCTAEQCNGRDDDCDGVVDNGCPISGQPLVTRTMSTTSAVFGSVTYAKDLKFADACPDGQAVIGFTGSARSGPGRDRRPMRRVAGS